jgi:vitamin B12 transporter
MYFSDEELTVISSTRSLKSITRVAENITVITAEEIELMNAHTVADVLYWTNGVQMNISGGPGSVSTASIQGSGDYQVSVFLDGIPLNNLADNVTDLGLIPVQFIEKIEIIKGPASSVWGSSLGGVINIITKSPGNDEKASGTLSVSYGQENTGDFRGELYGKKNDFGYYLQAGRLQSDGLNGLPPNSSSHGENIYSKLSYDLSKDSSLLFTLLYTTSSRGKGAFPDPSIDYSENDKPEHFLSSLSFNTALAQKLALSLSFHVNILRNTDDITQLSTGDLFESTLKDKTYGGSAKFTYTNGIHTVVIGSDYDDATLDITEVGTTTQETSKKWAVFVNDTIALSKLSITPGLRYDNQEPFGNFVSPSLGMTYSLLDNLLLRAYVARGFNNAGLGAFMSDVAYGYLGNPNLQVEKIWSYQLGVETTALKYLWLKVSAFMHDLRDTITSVSITNPVYSFTDINGDHQRRQGFEIDFKTIPVYHFSLVGGTTFIDAEDTDTDQEVKGIPRYTYDLGLKYDDEKSFKAMLRGHYIWWNSTQEVSPGSEYNAWVVDVNLIKNLLKQKQNRRPVDIFLVGHNIFNGTQRLTVETPNPTRWIEGGIRVKF